MTVFMLRMQTERELGLLELPELLRISLACISLGEKSLQLDLEWRTKKQTKNKINTSFLGI